MFKKTDFITILACLGFKVYRDGVIKLLLPKWGGGSRFIDTKFTNLGPFFQKKMPAPLYIMENVCGVFLLNSCYKSVPVIVTIIDDPHYFAHSCPKSTYLYKIHEILTNFLRPIARTNGPILGLCVLIWIWLQIFEASCKGFCLFSVVSTNSYIY